MNDPAPTSPFSRFTQGLNRRVEVLLAIMGMTMAAIVAVQVFFRYVLNDSLFWSEELARYLLVWLSFLGASSAYHRGAHPAIDILVARLPAAARRMTAMLVHGVSLALFAVMVVYGSHFAWFVRVQISPALGLPKWILFSVIPVSGAIMALYAAERLIPGGRRQP